MTRLASPYLAPGFYDEAIAKGRHRDIVGGRWGETARVQMAALQAEGMTPEDHLLDIGCGSLRLGHLAVPYLKPGHYWGTDASLALMRHGRLHELANPEALPEDHLIEDTDFAYPGVPATITLAIAFGVFTHLPAPTLAPALQNLRRFPRLRACLFTVFLAPEGSAATRQPDGVVTHPDRPPYHVSEASVAAAVRAAGFIPTRKPVLLPRGQVLWVASPPQIP
ncbi:MAG: class I SAM-dependent methyltransferase [Tabrizicola sp.]|nr:class I SAM-dependent methyltransferase [Tabrizicola sp.]